MANIERDNESQDSPFTKYQRPSRRTDEQVEVKASFGPYDGKFSVKLDEQ